MMLDPNGPNLGLGSWPARRARIDPDKVALRQDDRAYTYAQLADRTARVAGVLADAGVGPGDRVAYLGPNDTATFEVLFACGWMGAVFVPLNWRLTPSELGYQLRDSGAEVLVAGAAVEQLVEGVLAESTPVKRVLTVRGGGDDLDRLADGREEQLRPAEVGLDRPAVLLYTSGTTGSPKAAVLSHDNLTWNTVNQLAHFDIAHDDHVLCISPMFHAVGLSLVTLPTLLKGGTVEVLDGFDAGTVLRLIEERGVSSFGCVPTMLQLMAEHPAFADTDVSSISYVIFGGSPVPERVATAWMDRGVPLLQGYGMTEASPGVCAAVPEGIDRHPVSVGVPHFFTDVAARTPDGVRPLAPGGGAAELVVRGPNVFSGYWQNEQATRAAFVDGWYATGDVVSVEPDGWAHVVDRVKDLIISGGENIYPAEIEAVLMQLPQLSAAAVVGMPDERWGEVGVAYLELADGAHLTEQQVRDHLSTRLARYKIPKSFHFIDQVPRNASGKIRRPDLRDRARHESTGAAR